jgi:hypothetical protein
MRPHLVWYNVLEVCKFFTRLHLVNSQNQWRSFYRHRNEKTKVREMYSPLILQKSIITLCSKRSAISYGIALKLIRFFYGAIDPSGRGLPHGRGFTITLRHNTMCRTSLDEWPARRRNLYLTTQNTHKKQTSMPTMRFEPAIPENEEP